MAQGQKTSRLHRRRLLLGAAALVASAALPYRVANAAEPWRKEKAFGVELEVPTGWKRVEYRKPPEDHDEIMFAENARELTAGAWFSVFPNNQELLDPDRTERPFAVDGRPARMTDFLTRADDPPPRRRQIIIYFSDSRMPGFLFDGNSEKWATLGPLLDRIVASIRLPKR
jgi:hypothetical protein